MAEIRSTMDLVMEKAARMGKATSDEMQQEAAQKRGMQMAAEFLNSPETSLSGELSQQPPQEQESLRKGMLTALIRNIFLAREESAIPRIESAIRGIIDLAGGAGDVSSMCGELQSIVSQYSKHRDQYYEQLKQQMTMQIHQMLAQKGMQPDGLDLDPTHEPQFKEEWARIEGELNGQYEQALAQYKAQLNQRLGI